MKENQRWICIIHSLCYFSTMKRCIVHVCVCVCVCVSVNSIRAGSSAWGARMHAVSCCSRAHVDVES